MVIFAFLLLLRSRLALDVKKAAFSKLPNLPLSKKTESPKKERKMYFPGRFSTSKYCTTKEAERLVAQTHLMTLNRVKDGELDFFVAEAEIEGQQWYVRYGSYEPVALSEREEKMVRGTRERVPEVLVRIFPELADERFFVAEIEKSARSIDPFSFQPDPNVKWICEFLGDNKILRWKLPAVSDLSTSQIIALLVLEWDENGYGYAEDIKIQGVEFGDRIVWVKEAAVKELVHRSLVDFHHPATQATAWLVNNFNKDSHIHVEWLRQVLEHDGLSQLCERFPQSVAVKFAENEPITGESEQWGFLTAIPANRKEVRLSCTKDSFSLPNGETVPVQTCSGGSYCRVREDGRIDLFLRRGSRQMGDKGWMWVRVNPQAKVVEDFTERAIDPLENYSALRESFSPLFGRIIKALPLL